MPFGANLLGFEDRPFQGVVELYGEIAVVCGEDERPFAGHMIELGNRV